MVGGALLRADAVSALAQPGGIAVTLDFWELLHDDDTNGWLPVRGPEPSVLIPQDPSGNARRIDAAVPDQALVNEQIDLLVQVRFPGSPLLGIENWSTVRRTSSVRQTSARTNIKFPVDRQRGTLEAATLEIRVIAPEFEISGDAARSIEVPPDRESPIVAFLMSPKVIGSCRINVEIYTSDKTYLGAIPLETNIARVADVPSAPSIANLVLVIMVQPDDWISAASGLGTDPTQNRPVETDNEIGHRPAKELHPNDPRPAKLLRITFLAVLCVAVLVTAWRFLYQPTNGPPTITIAQVPPYDEVGGTATSGDIAGEISGEDSSDVRVVIYALTKSTWYVQPFDYDPFTLVEHNGKWSRSIHRGTNYAALLVKSTFQPPAKLSSLPAIGGDVLAKDEKEGER